MESILAKVDTERIYQHILKIEGEKHPIHSAEALEACADYIFEEFDSYGLSAEAHEFVVEGFDHTFRNIEARVGNSEGPELLIVSHYDTGRHAPGANDNGSAIAVMLEAARTISQTETSGVVRFVSFNLEELNPARSKRITNLALAHGIIDDKGRYTSWHAAKNMNRFSQLYSKYATGNTSFDDAVQKAISEMESDLSSNELEYLKELRELNRGLTVTSWPGKTALAGSTSWLRDAKQRRITVKGVLCLETMGYTSTQKNSQQFPSGMDPDMFKIFKTDSTLTIGDFFCIIGDRNSEALAKAFCTQCELDSIDLPYACLQEDFNYEQAAYIMPDLLRSDHAPFWRENIPALLLTDTANFRYPFYHTHADTIDKLDFDFLTKICKAVVALSTSF
jgi:hypothetical protein